MSRLPAITGPSLRRHCTCTATSLHQRSGVALLCAAALLTSPRPALADDSRYQDFPVGSRATALGGAFVALADDPSGLFYNPAGICDARRLNVSVSASLYGIERQSRGSLGIDRSTFSLATLNTLNVIPGEAGLLKGVGALDERGTPWAFGFDVTVPSFRSYGSDQTSPEEVHTRVLDRTFDLAVGAGLRWNQKLNLGFALHYVLRLFDNSEDALVLSGDPKEPTLGVYHATASFQNGNLVGLAGAKYRLDERWILGAALGLPGIPVHSAGTVRVQDELSDPNAPAGSRTAANVFNTSEVESRTPVPLLLRLGFARIEAHRWTVSSQLTLHGGAQYDRFTVPANVASRLRLQNTVQRAFVFDLNAGGEYLINPEYSFALGLFTDRSGAPALDVSADGALKSASSHLPRVALYGGTASLGLIGAHAISRLGISLSYGTGDEAVPNDPTGTQDPTGYRIASVHQLFLYVFLASTFRY